MDEEQVVTTEEHEEAPPPAATAAEIAELARSASLPVEELVELAVRGATRDEVQAACHAHVTRRAAPVIRPAAPENDDPLIRRARTVDALDCRMTGDCQAARKTAPLSASNIDPPEVREAWPVAPELSSGAGGAGHALLRRGS